MSRGLAKHDEFIFEKYKSDIVGYHESSLPIILCRDVDMIKHVMVKDFSHFVNRRVFCKKISK